MAWITAYEQLDFGASILGESETDNEIHMISFYLLPENIGQGFGQTFYGEIEKEMRKKGFATCVIDVLENNKMAIHPPVNCRHHFEAVEPTDLAHYRLPLTVSYGQSIMPPISKTLA